MSSGLGTQAQYLSPPAADPKARLGIALAGRRTRLPEWNQVRLRRTSRLRGASLSGPSQSAMSRVGLPDGSASQPQGQRSSLGALAVTGLPPSTRREGQPVTGPSSLLRPSANPRPDINGRRPQAKARQQACTSCEKARSNLLSVPYGNPKARLGSGLRTWEGQPVTGGIGYLGYVLAPPSCLVPSGDELSSALCACCCACVRQVHKPVCLGTLGHILPSADRRHLGRLRRPKSLGLAPRLNARSGLLAAGLSEDPVGNQQQLAERGAKLSETGTNSDFRDLRCSHCLLEVRRTFRISHGADPGAERVSGTVTFGACASAGSFPPLLAASGRPSLGGPLPSALCGLASVHYLGIANC